jgi:hypothetical protein
MTARTLTVDDIDWAVATLGRRRESLVEKAPVFWAPAPDAARSHRAFVEHLLSGAGGVGYRTDTAVLIAAPRGDGWLVDDTYVPGERWTDGDGSALWGALAADHSGAAVRFVCPTYERERGEFARTAGLKPVESWWLYELPGSGGGRAGAEIELPGATARTVGAPPVYAPPGPILFLPAPNDAAEALPAAVEQAPKLGCAAIVVNQRAGDEALGTDLTSAGFRRHCDYYTGTLPAA